MNASVSERVALQQLLCAIVSPDASEEHYASLNSQQAMKLIELANLNFMSFALYWGLKSKSLLDYFSIQEQAYLKEYFELNQQRNLEFISELHKVIIELNKLNIEPVLLKGAVALLAGWYEDIGERFLRDIDFLVPEQQAQQAFELLQSLGYTLVNPLDEKLHQLKTHQLAALHKPGSSLVIEIHTSPVSLKAEALLTANQVFESKVPVQPENFELLGINNSKTLKCYFPSPEHCLLIAIIHTQIADDNYKKGLFFLRHGMDVQRIIKRYPLIDFKNIDSLFNEAGFDSVFTDYLATINYFYLSESSTSALPVESSNEYLSRVINNIASQVSQTKNNTEKNTEINRHSAKKRIFKEQLIEAFSKEKIVMRYRANNALSVFFYRLVNAFRLLVKYTSANNRKHLNSYLDEGIDTQTFLDDSRPAK